MLPLEQRRLPHSSNQLIHSLGFYCFYVELLLSVHAIFWRRIHSKDKWDSSGGNEALGRMSASIPDSTKTMVGSMFKKEHFRGPAVFFGIGEERGFYVEKTPSLLVERLRHNVTFFYLNYLTIAAILFFLTLLVSPSAIIGLGLLVMVWVWLIRASQEGTLRLSASKYW